MSSACFDEEEPEFRVTREGKYEVRKYRHRNLFKVKYLSHRINKYVCVAESIASLSKDPSTKVGALIFGPGYEIRSQGWNGAPRGCRADEDVRFSTREEKYWWVSHAELNAITNAARSGTALDGCAILTTRLPCMNCAKAIVQAGITEVIALYNEDYETRWAEDVRRTIDLFYECDVHLVVLKPISDSFAI